jgi:peptidoglycan/xylan/chitin deacetylase (PgdA/CDA1 family)
MESKPLSRRALLRLGGLGVVGLAGCMFSDEENGPSTGTTRPSTTTRTRTATPSPTTERTTGQPTGTTEKPTTQQPTEEQPTEERPTDDSDEEPEGPADLCRANPYIAGSDPLYVFRNSRELRKCAGRPLDPFEDLSVWTVDDGSRDPSSDAFVGNQALALATASGSRIEASRSFPEGVDLSDRDLSLAIDVTTPPTDDLTISLLAPDDRNTVSCERKINSAGWYRIDFAPSAVEGSPDLSDVRGISLSLTAGNGAQLVLDSLRTTERASRGAVMLTFDDNSRSQYETAFPITQEYGFPGVVSVIPETAGDSSRIPLDGMYEMQGAGWEMISHPQEEASVPEMSSSRIEEAIAGSKQWLVDNGFENGSEYIVWPYNAYNAETLEVASRYHHLGFAFGGCPISKRVTGALSIGRVHGDEVDRSKRMIDMAARYNTLAVIMYHTVGEDNDRISESEFREVMDRIRRANVDVITASDLWESLPT